MPGQISLQCGMVPNIYFFIFPSKSQISWQGASHFACFLPRPAGYNTSEVTIVNEMEFYCAVGAGTLLYVNEMTLQDACLAHQIGCLYTTCILYMLPHL